MRILREVGGIDEGEPFIRLMHALALQKSGATVEAQAAIDEARAHVEARAAKIADEASRATFLAVWENAQTLKLANGS